MELSSLSTTFWKYALLTVTILISILCVPLMQFGVVALGCAGSPLGAVIFASLGSLVFCDCFLGSFASLRESYVLSIAFVIATVVCIALKIVSCILLGVYDDDLRDSTIEQVNNLWESENTTAGSLDLIQAKYTCCGKDSPQDYLHDDDDVLPPSCCFNNDCLDKNNIFTEGCVDATTEFFEQQTNYLVLTMVALIIVEILGIVSAYYLAKRVQHRSTKTEQIVISE